MHGNYLQLLLGTLERQCLIVTLYIQIFQLNLLNLSHLILLRFDPDINRICLVTQIVNYRIHVLFRT